MTYGMSVGPHAEVNVARSPFTFNATYGGPSIEGEPYTVAETFIGVSATAAAEQTALLNLITYHKNESDELAAGIRLFDRARRMTVDAFYTSKIGTKALNYRGNTV
jgi:hypothetical protein